MNRWYRAGACKAVKRATCAVRSTTGGGVASLERWRKFNAFVDRVLLMNWLLALDHFLV
jgi:hypothetical protein